MKLILFAMLSALLLTLAAGYVALPILKKLRVIQTLSGSVSDVQGGKKDTPTMFGAIFLFVGVTLSALIAITRPLQGRLYLFCALCTLAFAAIGCADDALKVFLRRNEGLTARQKLLLQVLAAAVFAFWAYFNPNIGSALRIPFTSAEVDIGIFYIPFVAFVIVAVDNSVNLLDGLDGLCAGSSAMQFALFGAVALLGGESLNNVALFAFVMCACLAGYLRFNGHPARVFMGDVGSLGIGGALAALAIVTRSALIIPLALITALISALSDIAQIAYMRRHKGRRLLRMSPLHHHYEKAGVPEQRIVTAYNILTFGACLLALMALI